MAFIDRVSAYPNRYMMTLENGGTSYVVLERADEPVIVGTPLNAETFNKLMVESAEHPGCYYRTVDGAVEWLNPPMVVGVEYRTTERYMGEPVYTKLVNCGAFGFTGTTLTHGLGSEKASFIRQEARVSGNLLPTGDGKSRIEINSTQVVVYNEDTILGAEDLYVHFWYIKR